MATPGGLVGKQELIDAQLDTAHLGRVVNSKDASGAPINTSTNRTGGVNKTLDALEAEYQGEIDSLESRSDAAIADAEAEFDASITAKESEADAAIDEYRLLNKGPYTPGITLESKFEFITYSGESYFALNPPYTTTATLPDNDTVNLGVKPYLTEQNGDSRYSASFKQDVFGSAIENMLTGRINGSSVVTHTVGNTYTVGYDAYQVISVTSPMGVENFKALSAREVHQVNMGVFYAKMQKDDASETITIACRGDSLSYGEDTTVDPQPADPTTTPSGRVHTKTRASTPYPEALQTYLQPLFSNTINVINQGYSGDTTKAGYEDWDTDVNSDLTVIMYGTNDAAEGFSSYQPIEDFIKYYRLIIQREIIVRRAAVVLITPPQQKQINNNVRLLDAYRMAVYQLANEFGCPVIDGIEVFKNVDSTLFSDLVHYRTLGYQWLASAVQARILSKTENFTRVYSGSNMTVRFAEEGVKANWSNWGVQTAKVSQVTPPLTSFSGGYVVETSSYFEKICFSFYCEQDDIIAMPNIEIGNATVAVQLNNGIWQPQYTFDGRVQSTGDLTAKPDALYEYSALNEVVSINRNATYEVSKANRLHIATRGWKTLTLYIKSNGSTGSPRLTVGGVNFESYETVEMWDRHFYGVFGQQKPLGNVTPRYVGQFYTDTTPPTASNPTTQVVWLATGLTSANWKVISDIGISQSLLPTGNVAPYALGQMYLYSTSVQFKWYKASGLTVSDWVQISNN
ncbi:hypothetical protein SIPHO063v1_p0044 [Vibrio phage PS10B.1]|nr:hypothetical protein SIPHO063v1_p0044 [Vibrio phage PS10B.1]